MLTPATRLRLQAILERIGAAEAVSLADRIYVQKFADRDATVASWLRRARRRQLQANVPVTGVDRLLADLDLGEVERNAAYDPEQEDLGDWFGGAPGWLRRS